MSERSEALGRHGATGLRLVPFVMVLLAALVAVRAGVSDALPIPSASPPDVATNPANQPAGQSGPGSRSTTSGSAAGGTGAGSSAPPTPGAVPGSSTPAPALPAPGPGQSPTNPPGVAVVDPLLDALRTGFTAGPGTFLGILNGLISVAVGPLSQLPGGTDVAVMLSQILADMQKPTAEFQAVMLNTIESLRSVLSGLSVANPTLNQALEQSAANLETIARQYGPQIQPFDGMLLFFAGVLRDQIRE